MHKNQSNETVENLAGKLLSIQVATPETIRDHEGEWKTAFFKRPVTGPQTVEKLGIAGDGQADRKHHGGIDKAVLAYAASHYATWKDELKIEFIAGGFGENLTIEVWDETSVCVGDQFRIGDVTLEVSQPRQPCWKLGRRWSEKTLPKQVIQNGRTGWYFRVLQTGRSSRAMKSCWICVLSQTGPSTVPTKCSIAEPPNKKKSSGSCRS